MQDEVNQRIHPLDQMLSFAATTHGGDEIARSAYFRGGEAIMDGLRQLVRWRFGGFDNLGAFLDFASGYGRLTRFLVRELPSERIWVSDIQPKAVAFQEEEFGVHGIVSATRPEEFVCDRQFDCIFVASLFSHLPEATFAPWLQKLYDLLKPDGLLVFSVHSEGLLTPGRTMPEPGILFDEASEIETLDTRDYGVSFVTEAFVQRAIRHATSGREAYLRIPYGLQYHQDLYLVAKSEHPDFSGLRYEYEPGGAVDYCGATGTEELCVGGWAADLTPGGSIQEVQVEVNGDLRQRSIPFCARLDVSRHYQEEQFLHSGWECLCYVPGLDPADILRVKAVSGSGTERVLYHGTVGAAMTQPGLPSASRGSDLRPPRHVMTYVYDEIERLSKKLDEKDRYLAELHGVVAVKNEHIAKLEELFRVQRRTLDALPVRVVRRLFPTARG